ncbi:MAG TPA: cupin domain-containing protein [Steroidobacteraceae bacterium]|nr:cupin domain-containing protein [Steroidobacteraceae bacterium]
MAREITHIWRSGRWLALLPCALAWIAGDAATAPAVTVTTLMQRELADLPGKEALMLTVEYPPGAASLPHRHDADVFVYVLEGEVTMQVAGQPAVTLGPGGTFFEGPADVHVQSANTSARAPAKLLVVMVKERGAPVSRAVTAAQGGSR